MSAHETKARRKGKDIGVAELADQLEHAFLAGLGALSHPTDIGSKSFNALVREGEKFRKRATDRTEELLDNVQGAIRDLAGGAQSRASGLIGTVRDSAQVEKLNSIFDQRVAAALDRLGVPTKKDVNRLNRKLDKVLAAVEGKPATREAPKKKVAKKRAAKKKVARKKVASKTASKKKVVPRKASARK